MSIWKRKKKTRSSDGVATLMGEQLFDSLTLRGYKRLDQNPEVLTCARKITDLISSMTIHLMSNTENGDQRIVNELSRKVDINPSQYMTRKHWMEAIIMNLLVYGNGNSIVLPKTENGLLGDMVPIRPADVRFEGDGYKYKIYINNVLYEPSEVIHFVMNPDKYYPWKGCGIRAAIQDVVNNLEQATATEKGFLGENWRPSVIIKVDGIAEEMSSEEGRNLLLDEYIKNSGEGKPWVIPSEFMDVSTIKPLTLGDLAIRDTVELNKTAVAAIMGVPPFVLGVGEFKVSEWNNFINTTVLPIARGIEQEMTKKLILSNKWYFKFNAQSLYAYDIDKLENVYSDLYVKGLAPGNEVRDRLGLPPIDGLDELVILENYIPLNKVGDQLKLKQGEENE